MPVSPYPAELSRGTQNRSRGRTGETCGKNGRSFAQSIVHTLIVLVNGEPVRSSRRNLEGGGSDMKGADPYGASKAIRPWDGTSLSSQRIENQMRKGRKPTHEYFEGVRKCLSCQLPQNACNKCKGPTGKRDLQRRKEIVKLIRSGATYEEIAEKYKVKPKTIKYYAKKYEKEMKDPCIDCRTPAICKAMGKPCTVKERWEIEWR